MCTFMKVSAATWRKRNIALIATTGLLMAAVHGCKTREMQSKHQSTTAVQSGLRTLQDIPHGLQMSLGELSKVGEIKKQILNHSNEDPGRTSLAVAVLYYISGKLLVSGTIDDLTLPQRNTNRLQLAAWILEQDGNAAHELVLGDSSMPKNALIVAVQRNDIALVGIMMDAQVKVEVTASFENGQQVRESALAHVYGTEMVDILVPHADVDYKIFIPNSHIFKDAEKHFGDTRGSSILNEILRTVLRGGYEGDPEEDGAVTALLHFIEKYKPDLTARIFFYRISHWIFGFEEQELETEITKDGELYVTDVAALAKFLKRFKPTAPLAKEFVDRLAKAVIADSAKPSPSATEVPSIWGPGDIDEGSASY